MVGFLTLVGKGMLDYKIGQREREWESMQELMKFKREQEGKMNLAKYKQDIKNKQTALDKNVNLISSLNVPRWNMIDGVKTEDPVWKFGNFEVNPNLPPEEKIRTGLQDWSSTIFNSEENREEFLNAYLSNDNYAKELKTRLTGFAQSGKLLNIERSKGPTGAIIRATNYNRIMPGLFDIDSFNDWYHNDLWNIGTTRMLGDGWEKKYDIIRTDINKNDGTVTKEFKLKTETMPPPPANTSSKDFKIWSLTPVPDQNYVNNQYFDPLRSIAYNQEDAFSYIDKHVPALLGRNADRTPFKGKRTTPENLMNEIFRQLPSNDAYNKTEKVTKSTIFYDETQKKDILSQTVMDKATQQYSGGKESIFLVNTIISSMDALDDVSLPTGGLIQDLFTIWKGATGYGGQFDQARNLVMGLEGQVFDNLQFRDLKTGELITGRKDTESTVLVATGRKLLKQQQAEISAHMASYERHKRAGREEDARWDYHIAQIKTMQTILAYRLAVIVQGGEGGRTVSDADFAKALVMVGAGTNWTTTNQIKGKLRTVGAYSIIAAVGGYAAKQYGGTYRYKQGAQFVTDLANRLAKEYNPDVHTTDITQPIRWWVPPEDTVRKGLDQRDWEGLDFGDPWKGTGADTTGKLDRPTGEDLDLGGGYTTP